MTNEDFNLLSDEELAALSRNGNPEAGGALMYRYKDTVKAIARQYFLAGGDTDDLVQEGMFALYLAVSQYSPKKECSFKSFACLCIRHRIFDAIKSSCREKNRALNGFVEIASVAETELAPESNEPEAIFLKNERGKQLYSFIESNLNEKEFELFRLYLSGLSYADMASKTALTEKQIDNKLQRIKRKLKNLLNDWHNL